MLHQVEREAGVVVGPRVSRAGVENEAEDGGCGAKPGLSPKKEGQRA